MFSRSTLFNPLLALFFSSLPFVFALLPLLFFLSPNFELPGLLFLPLILGSLLFRFSCYDAFQVDDSLFEAVNFRAEAHKLSVDLESLLVLFLAFKSVAKGQVGIDVVLAVLDAFLEVGDGLGVLAADVVQDSCVVENDGIDWVKVDCALVVIQRISKLASTLHVDSHVLQDAWLPRVVPYGVFVLGEGLRPVAELLVNNAQVHLRFVVIGL